MSVMVSKLIENPSVRLLKHIVRCYLRLSEHQKAREALRQCLPDALRDQTFANVVRSEESVQRWLVLLLKNLNENSSNPTHSGATRNMVNTANANVGSVGGSAWNAS